MATNGNKSNKGRTKGKPENLKPMNLRTKSEVKAITKKAGIASGIARRRLKSLKEITMFLLDSPCSEAEFNKVKKLLPEGITKEDVSKAVAMQLAQIGKAIDGNVLSAQYARDTSGQKPVDKVQQDITNSDGTLSPVQNLSDEELKKLLEKDGLPTKFLE